MSRYVDIDKLKLPLVGYDENGDALLSIRDVMRILEKSVEDDVTKAVKCGECENYKCGICDVLYATVPYDQTCLCCKRRQL